mgnify:CR=1 FL=1
MTKLTKEQHQEIVESLSSDFVLVRKGKMFNVLGGAIATALAIVGLSYVSAAQGYSEAMKDDAIQQAKADSLRNAAKIEAILEKTPRLASDFPTVMSDIAKSEARIETLETIRVPIGGIIAWHTTGGETLPTGWMECNGDTVLDDESPFNGNSLPNLNVGDGTGRFLRGSTGVTGTEQEPTKHPYMWATGTVSVSGVKAARVYFPSVKHIPENTESVFKTGSSTTNNLMSAVTGSVKTKTHREQYYTSRPSSITVRWIIRIK